MNPMNSLLLVYLLSGSLAWAHQTGDASHDRRGRSGGKIEATHKVEIETTETKRIISSNGWPDHEPGQFPRPGNPNRITEQEYEFKMTLKPEIASRPSPAHRAFFAVALNGVPLEPGTAEVWNNDRSSGWHYQAMTNKINLGLDRSHAHVQPNGAYHYHGLPVGLLERLGAKDGEMTLVAWAADGFPMYAVFGHEDADNPKSVVRELKSSYRMKSGNRPEEENGPGGKYDGRFEEDFEYVEGLGDLDEFNGREGVTPEFPEGTYYYVLSHDYPFIARSWKGTPDPSFRKSGGRGRGPGGGPRGEGHTRPGGGERPAGPPPWGRPPGGPPPRHLPPGGGPPRDGPGGPPPRE